MAVLEIKIIPDPVLRRQAVAVDLFDAALHKLLGDMRETMDAAHGLGIAAPQVGVSKRVAIIDLSVARDDSPEIQIQSRATPQLQPGEHLHGELIEIINPVIKIDSKQVSSDEGCLNIPEYRDTIKRGERVIVEASDRFGRPYTITAQGLLCFALQHEIDHLDGVLFTDHLSRLKRPFFKKWLDKQGYESS